MLLNAGSLSSCSGHTFTTPIISARDAVDPIPQGYPGDVRADLANEYGNAVLQRHREACRRLYHYLPCNAISSLVKVNCPPKAAAKSDASSDVPKGGSAC